MSYKIMEGNVHKIAEMKPLINTTNKLSHFVPCFSQISSFCAAIPLLEFFKCGDAHTVF